ncbi:MAG: decarboxylating 6-phosphogluconate dehydrogenase [Deltaproteobacteria bacterium]|nr:MAG: decarboxylating 6-phosphogluconate dehydrogenase [Deltaproteobacteria bacterium]
MELGMIGLGRMGANMTERLLRGGHRVVSYDRSSQAVQSVVGKGASAAESLEALAVALRVPRVVWLMVPSGDPVIPYLKRDDVIVDGGNSNYKDTLRRAAMLKEKSVHYVDVGTSGGIWGLTEGYSLMVGADREVVERLTPIFQTLAPAPDRGWGHVGPSGAGHFVKMIHNGIEYGLMQSFAEGFAIMEHKAEFKLDLLQIAEIWRHGSVVRSWLLDLIAKALAENPNLRGIRPYVEDSGEGRWTVAEAVDLEVSAPVITLSLLERLRSRDQDSFTDKLLAMMRHQFGGHPLKEKK